MLSHITTFFKKPAAKGSPLMREPASASPMRRDSSRQASYSKVFRWRLPDGQTQEPKSVEIVGSFTHWQRVPLQRDSILDAWHVTLHHIQGNKTHHYMLLVDGKPTIDKTCDGLAPPHGAEETRYQFMTEKGPRVFMLFGQTK